jgi:large subunit ribosomal protein L4
MAKFDVYDLTATKVGDIELADSVFNIEVNNQAIFDAVLRQRASWRQGTHDTKSRAEVSGGGKKPYKQKGTGHARQGSTRATQFRGGGIAFGPTPRSYGFKLNRKVRRLALRGAISLKAQSENLVVLDSMEMAEIKTKEFVKVMEAFGFERKVLFVVDTEEEFVNAYMSLRNLPNAAMITANGVNVFDVLDANKLVMTKAAAKKVEEVFND